MRWYAWALAILPVFAQPSDSLAPVKDLIHLDRYAEAQQSLEEYLKTHAQSAEARFLLGYVLFRRNEPRKSLETYTAAAKLGRPHGADFKIVGLDYVLLNDLPDAVRWLERAVAEDPRDAEAAYHLGRALYTQNQFDRAIDAFQQALRLDPQYSKAENNLGLVYAAKNELDAAETAYRKAIQMDEQSGKRSEQPYMNLAEMLIQRDGVPEALVLLDTAKEIQPQSGRIEELRGKALLIQNRLADAEAAFRAALASEPESGALHYQLGRVLKREGRAGDAKREFDRSATLLKQAGRPDSAANDPEVLYRSGMTALASGRNQEAQTAFEEAVRARANFDQAIYGLARTYLAEGQAHKAEEQMRRYLELKPEDASAHYGLGYILIAEQKVGEARAAFEKSLAIQPRQAESLFQLGEIDLQGGRNNEAKKEFLQALSCDPKHAGALTGMGILAYRSGTYEEAGVNLKRAIASAPNYQKAHYYYALTLAKSGHRTEAEREFHLSNDLNKDHVPPGF